MKKAIVEQLDSLLMEGSEISSDYEIDRWSRKTKIFLRTTLGDELAREFSAFDSSDEWDVLSMQLGLLQGIIAKAQDDSRTPGTEKTEVGALQQNPHEGGPKETRKVFVVHGHDEAAKEATARFLAKLDLQPIILHEQSSGGRTIIDKFEKYSGDVGFAVVLLTPDDLGAARKEKNRLQPRARQNVVLELGYFLGRLARNRVCALYKGGVELPSDIQGVIYVEMDDAGAWRTKLAQELAEAKCPINLHGLVSG